MDSWSFTKYLFCLLVESIISWVDFMMITYGMVSISRNTISEYSIGTIYKPAVLWRDGTYQKL